MGSGEGEKDFTATVLVDDAKNYHAWAHRQWAVERLGLWDGELDMVDGAPPHPRARPRARSPRRPQPC